MISPNGMLPLEGAVGSPYPPQTAPSIPLVMTDEDIIREYMVTKSFINRHSKEMGCYFHRPRRFLRNEVQEFFSRKAQEKKSKAGNNSVDKREYAMRIVKEVCHGYKRRALWQL